MKSVTEYITFSTKKHREFINITHDLESFLKKTGIGEGLLLVSAMHITAAVFINDNESGFLNDLEEMLEKLAPSGVDYRHHRTGEDNGDAHLKNILVGHQVIIPITKGKFDFGPWQQVFYGEFDGQRPKRLLLKAIGE